jgi:16S rRNA (guanine527-N7)-methyltransferase
MDTLIHHVFARFLPTVTLTADEMDRIKTFYTLHEKFKKLTSLVRYKNAEDFLVRHLVDSWQLKNMIPKGAEILDIGSGGGFPGVILALSGHPVTLSDVDEKKRFFLTECCRILNLTRVRVMDDSRHYNGGGRIITARAVAALDDLFHLTPHTNENGTRFFSALRNASNQGTALLSGENVSRETFTMFFPKGQNYANELKEAEKNWLFSYRLHASVTDAHSKILEINGVCARG